MYRKRIQIVGDPHATHICILTKSGHRLPVVCSPESPGGSVGLRLVATSMSRAWQSDRHQDSGGHEESESREQRLRRAQAAAIPSQQHLEGGLNADLQETLAPEPLKMAKAQKKFRVDKAYSAPPPLNPSTA